MSTNRHYFSSSSQLDSLQDIQGFFESKWRTEDCPFFKELFLFSSKSLTLGHNNDVWPSSELSSPWKHHTLKDGSNSNTKGQIS